MKYANTRTTIIDKDHLELVINITGMKVNECLVDTMGNMLKQNLTIVFDDGFDSDNDYWVYDYSVLEEETLSLKEIFIGKQGIDKRIKELELELDELKEMKENN